jgi:endo-1,4-beta-mannosidase
VRDEPGVPGFGVNYWPAYAGPSMWRDFRPEEIEADLGALARSGVSFIRAFLLWPDFMPTPDGIDPRMLERLDRFVGLVGRSGLRLHLTLLVGHMSGENWSPPWLSDPSALYADEGLLKVQERMVTDAVARVRAASCVEAYVITNEFPHFTGPAPAGAVEGWARRLYAAVKAADPGRPVGLGDGAAYVVGGRTGFEPGFAQDVIAPHLYLSDTHEEGLIAAFGLAVGVARAFGKEVWLEEVGAPHSTYGEDEIAAWAGRVAFEARLQGATRVCWWCGLDFDPRLAATAPYSHHAFELSFGMLRSDRTPKPVASALRSAMSTPLPDLPEAGLLVPDALIGTVPFAPLETELTTRALRNAYAALRRMGYLPRPVLEAGVVDGVPQELLVVPAARMLGAPTWEGLERHPGRVVGSYFHGTRGFHGSWTHRAADFFGGTPRNRFGVPEPAPRRLEAVGLALELPESGDPFAATPLLLDPGDAQVLGRDEGGRPLWVRVGRRDLLLFPLEALASDPGTVESFYRAVLQTT